jgi:hypothetical protein
MTAPSKPVAIIMGSQSDWATMRRAAETLDELGLGWDARIVSAHRTPDRAVAFAKGARAAGFKVIIAGAGGAAHLAGVTAAFTTLPVFGVPMETRALGGQDSLYGGHAGDRRGGGGQRGADRGGSAGARRPLARRAAGGLARGAREQRSGDADRRRRAMIPA